MALTARQRRIYNHLCDIVKVTDGAIASGKPGDPTYSINSSQVPCHYEYTDNVSDPTGAVGRIKRTMIFTMDKIHFEASVIAGDGWFLINRTLRPDGSRHSLYGEVHRIEGEAKTIESTRNRHPNKKLVYGASVEKPPVEIQAMI